VLRTLPDAGWRRDPVREERAAEMNHFHPRHTP
jgi:hypothetical protein